MRKLIFTLILTVMMCLTFTSCHDDKKFTRLDGTEFVAEPWGWANTYKKIDGVVYEPVLGNIVWSVFAFETVIVPVWLTGWAIMEPVEYDPSQDPKSMSPISGDKINDVE